MAAIGPSVAKAEMFLAVLAAVCVVGAAVALFVQYTEPIPTTANTAANTETTAATEQDEPARVPLPAGPRKFQ
jgi:hypothetical protein